ncbi:MbcA/ParS/Xre antitoxin family protein [Trinickia sp. NRRL B-1857]|uniref:MbcA/ParS/Xre antitoxin family protein n=1 Tax=Trinickia sp. NRRL B-1857 TaxID=3162879 RepID=UPI003D2A3787
MSPAAAHRFSAAEAHPRGQAPIAAPSMAEMSAAGLRAFFNISRDWGLAIDEQIVLLGSPGRSTFFKWKAAPASARLSRDTLERLSLLLGIYKALQILLPEPAAADTWVKRPNSAPPFGGSSALDRMLAGNVSDLVAVRQYLDAMRGGWA